MIKFISIFWILFGIYILATNDYENQRLFLYLFITIILSGFYILEIEKS